MDTHTLSRFVVTTLAFVVLAMATAALLSPPDPLTQLYYLIPGVLFAPLISYWLVYRNGYGRVGLAD